MYSRVLKNCRQRNSIGGLETGHFTQLGQNSTQIYDRHLGFVTKIDWHLEASLGALSGGMTYYFALSQVFGPYRNNIAALPLGNQAWSLITDYFHVYI